MPTTESEVTSEATPRITGTTRNKGGECRVVVRFAHHFLASTAALVSPPQIQTMITLQILAVASEFPSIDTTL